MPASRTLLVAAIAASVLSLPEPAFAQKLLVVGGFCDYVQATASKDIYTFSADATIRRQVDDITSIAGGTPLPFETSAANVAVAAAAVRGSTRVLLYNQALFVTTEGADRWRIVAILAHQIGHHFLRHSLDSGANRTREELAADKFAGTVLHIMGASLEAATSALSTERSNQIGDYPTIPARVKEMTDGWTSATSVAKFGFAGDDDLPRFDLPPPMFSTFIQLSGVKQGSPPGADLGEVAAWLRQAMRTQGYDSVRYWAVRDGFAAATGIEQINDDGSSRAQDRWATTVSPPRVFSLRSYLNALFSAQKGRYRLIVFVVSPHAFAQRTTPTRFQPAIDWLWTGLLDLPKSVSSQKIDSNYRCTALIYEFEQKDAYSEATLITPSAIDGRRHLEMARLWPALSQ